MKQVTEVLNSRTKGACAVCGSDDLLVLNQLSVLPVYDSFEDPGQAGGSLPSLISVCRGCGNTQLFNIHVLGLAELLGIPPPDSIIWKTHRAVDAITSGGTGK